MVQLKMDGMRFNAVVINGKCEFRSRNGKELNLLGHLEDEFVTIAKGENIVFDGELIVTDGFGVMDRQTGNGILSKAGKGTISEEEASKVKAIIWDEIPVMFFKSGLYSKPYKDRFADLRNRITSLKSSGFKVEAVEWMLVESIEEAQVIFQQYFDLGEEGIILKDLESVWENKRSRKQIKFKGELECDLKIVGLEEGSGKYQGKLGSLLCESADGIVQVSVGSGLTDDHRSNLNSTELIGRICAVKYNARIKAKTGQESLFLPIFIEVRDDKTEADLSGDIK
jgi:ATP-dependent DNA ligase